MVDTGNRKIYASLSIHAKYHQKKTGRIENAPMQSKRNPSKVIVFNAKEPIIFPTIPLNSTQHIFV